MVGRGEGSEVEKTGDLNKYNNWSKYGGMMRILHPGENKKTRGVEPIFVL